MWQGSGEPSLTAAEVRGGPSPGADGVGKSPVSMQMWAGVSPASGACCVTHSPCEFCCASNAALAAGNPRRLVYRRGRLGRESGVTGVVDRYHVDCSKQTNKRANEQTNKQTNAAAPIYRNGNAATAGRPAPLPHGVDETPPRPVASCGTRCRQPFDDSPPSVPLRRMAWPSARQLA